MNVKSWVRPGFAALVVVAASVLVLAVLGIALHELAIVGSPTNPEPDPNAGTIAALAGSALTALAAITAAYFGVKTAAGAQATTDKALDQLKDQQEQHLQLMRDWSATAR